MRQNFLVSMLTLFPIALFGTMKLSADATTQPALDNTLFEYYFKHVPKACDYESYVLCLAVTGSTCHIQENEAIQNCVALHKEDLLVSIMAGQQKSADGQDVTPEAINISNLMMGCIRNQHKRIGGYNDNQWKKCLLVLDK